MRQSCEKPEGITIEVFRWWGSCIYYGSTETRSGSVLRIRFPGLIFGIFDFFPDLKADSSYALP
jgi:hypothetical protein